MSEAHLHLPDSIVGEQQIHERNNQLELLLDPNHELPKVALVDITTSTPALLGTIEGRYNLVHDVSGKCIGELQLIMPSRVRIAHGNAVARVSTVELYEAVRGKGYGRATYLELLKSLPLNVELESDATLTRGSFLIWKWLENSGVALHLGQKDSLVPDNKGLYQAPRFKTQLYKLHT